MECQSQNDRNLRLKAERLLRSAGVDLAQIADRSRELVVFGSYAAGLQTRVSDLDIFIVSEHALLLPAIRGADIVVRTEKQALSDEWLRSELAGHIAAYGRWISGEGGWRSRAMDAINKDDEAAERKQRRIVRLEESLRKHWDRLTPDFRRRSLVTIGREWQRLHLLKSGVPVPPTRILDIEAKRYEGDSGVAGMTSLLHQPYFPKSLTVYPSGFASSNC